MNWNYFLGEDYISSLPKPSSAYRNLMAPIARFPRAGTMAASGVGQYRVRRPRRQTGCKRVHRSNSSWTADGQYKRRLSQSVIRIPRGHYAPQSMGGGVRGSGGFSLTWWKCHCCRWDRPRVWRRWSRGSGCSRSSPRPRSRRRTACSARSRPPPLLSPSAPPPRTALSFRAKIFHKVFR